VVGGGGEGGREGGREGRAGTVDVLGCVCFLRVNDKRKKKKDAIL